jgi:hypothetical protein
MRTKIPLTEFAPVRRESVKVVQRQAAAIVKTPLTAALLSSVLNFVFILNPERQIVFASPNCGDLVPGKPVNTLLGQRPGEALGCIHAHETEGGCGTTKYCRECGAAQAILASLEGRANRKRAIVTRVINLAPEALNLLVYAVPFPFQGRTFSILSVSDASQGKRGPSPERLIKKALEAMQGAQPVSDDGGGLRGAKVLWSTPPNGHAHRGATPGL